MQGKEIYPNNSSLWANWFVYIFTNSRLPRSREYVDYRDRIANDRILSYYLRRMIKKYLEKLEKLSVWQIVLAAFVFRLLLSFTAWHPDVNNHVDWAIRFFQYGFSKFYAPESNVWSFTWPNQPPGTVYMFAGVKLLYDLIFQIVWFVNVHIPLFPSAVMTYVEDNFLYVLTKLPSILSDLGQGVLIYKVVKHLKEDSVAKFSLIVFLFNPASWYNSAVWGQTDAVINFFGLLAFYLLLQKRLVFALLMLSMSLYVKVSLAIFVPLFVIIMIRQRYEMRKVILAVLVSLGVIGLVTLPFSSHPVSFLNYVYTKIVLKEQLQLITANAFNIWAGIAGIHERPHEAIFLLLSYKYWGLLLFGLAYLPVLYLVYKKQEERAVYVSLALAAFSAFMFLTNMHERYLYPLFPAFTILIGLDRKLIGLFIAVSGIHLLNLYNFWWVPEIRVVVSVMSAFDRLLPRLLGFGMLMLFYLLYKRLYRANLR